jgi:hypothetical protein
MQLLQAECPNREPEMRWPCVGVLSANQRMGPSQTLGTQTHERRLAYPERCRQACLEGQAAHVPDFWKACSRVHDTQSFCGLSRLLL